MKRKRKKFGEERGDWPAVTAALLVAGFFALILFAPGAIFGETYVTPVSFPVQPDSFFVRWDKDGVTFNTDTCNTSVPTDTAPSWVLNDDTLHTISYLIWYPGQDSAASFVFQRDLRYTTGTRLVPTPAYWGYATDSVTMQIWRDGSSLLTRRRTAGQQSYDTTYQMADGSSYIINYKIFADNSTLPQNWVWTAYWDTTGGGTVESPALGDFAYVDGYLKYPNGQGVTGALVYAIRTGEEFATDTTGGTAVMYARSVPPVPTDTAGYFQLTLMRAGAYDDSIFYDITFNLGAEELGKVRRVIVPASGNLNLGDVQAER